MSFGSFVLLVSAALLGLSIANDTFGPWIVHFDEAIENSVFEATVQTVYNALPLLTKPSDFEITHSFKLALHAIVVKGLTEEQLLAIPGVELVNPDVMFKVEEYNWGTDRIDQESLPLDNSYNPDFDGQGVDAYIIDTGVDCGHIEFEGRVCENIYNAYGANTPNTDGQGHGTHCAGSVAGNTIGVATGVNTYGLKSLSDAGFGLSSASIEAMEMVIERHQSKPGARSVINMSLGSGCTNAYCAQDSSVIAVQNCVNAGIVVVTAAGNDFCNSCFFSPAAAVNGITVGATTIEDDIAYFSNFGQCIDMWAPGGRSYTRKSGTSMAAPHVAGVACQLLDKNPSATPDQVIKAMECDAVPMTLALDPMDTLSKNLMLQSPKDDGKFGDCTVGEGCTDGCSGEGSCLPAHYSKGHGTTEDICHCDGGFYGEGCESNNGRRWPTVESCSNSASSHAMPVTIELRDSAANNGWDFASFAITDPWANLVQAYAHDSFCSSGNDASATRSYCLEEGFYKLTTSSARSIAASATNGWTLCGQEGGDNFEGVFQVVRGSLGTFTCQFVSSAEVPTPSPTGTVPTAPPSQAPSEAPTKAPSASPSAVPSKTPTDGPTNSPVSNPTLSPTFTPTKAPTSRPSTSAPTNSPVSNPTLSPTFTPTQAPTSRPSTSTPTKKPTAKPSALPTFSPPTALPTTAVPTLTPTNRPSINLFPSATGLVIDLGQIVTDLTAETSSTTFALVDYTLTTIVWTLVSRMVFAVNGIVLPFLGPMVNVVLSGINDILTLDRVLVDKESLIREKALVAGAESIVNYKITISDISALGFKSVDDAFSSLSDFLVTAVEEGMWDDLTHTMAREEGCSALYNLTTIDVVPEIAGSDPVVGNSESSESSSDIVPGLSMAAFSAAVVGVVLLALVGGHYGFKRYSKYVDKAGADASSPDDSEYADYPVPDYPVPSMTEVVVSPRENPLARGAAPVAEIELRSSTGGEMFARI